VSTTLVGVYDKGSGAVIATECSVRIADTGKDLATTRSGLFFRGEGGFGGPRGPETDWEAPDREPDVKISYPTSPGQALIYRLNGDRNPLHSDPTKAKVMGFDRPILHGLCTYGFTCRGLLQGLCDGDVSRFGSMDARFSKPVLPGETLEVVIWPTDGGAQFQTRAGDRVVLDHGVFTFAG
jgi:acyl dehydratase